MTVEDRRTRRTRRLLKDAIVTLVLEHGYDQVTVEDITEHADISRATFYKYHRDKQALLQQVVEDLQDELSRRLEPLDLASARGFTGKPLLELFRHAVEERAAYRMILRGEGNGIALRAFLDTRAASAKEIFTRRAEFLGVELRIDADVLARAWVGEQAAVLQWWIEQEEPSLSIDQVTQMLLDLSRYGRFWANGFDGEPPPPPPLPQPGAEVAG